MVETEQNNTTTLADIAYIKNAYMKYSISSQYFVNDSIKSAILFAKELDVDDFMEYALYGYDGEHISDAVRCVGDIVKWGRGFPYIVERDAVGAWATQGGNLTCLPSEQIKFYESNKQDVWNFIKWSANEEQCDSTKITAWIEVRIFSNKKCSSEHDVCAGMGAYFIDMICKRFAHNVIVYCSAENAGMGK